MTITVSQTIVRRVSALISAGRTDQNSIISAALTVLDTALI